MGCRWLVQWSSLGPVVCRLKKVRALSIHLNSHTVGLSNCHPQPLNTPLKYHVLQLLCFFHQDWVLFVSGVYCDGYQFALAAKCCSCTQSLKFRLLFVLLKAQAIRRQKRNFILGAGSKALSVAFTFLLCFRCFFTVSTSMQPPKSTRTSRRKLLRWGSICETA